MKLRLFNLLSIRRLIRAQERQATALEELLKLARLNFAGTSGTVLEEYAPADTDLLYATDATTHDWQRRDASRVGTQRAGWGAVDAD
jgi:hypothetical protein